MRRDITDAFHLRSHPVNVAALQRKGIRTSAMSTVFRSPITRLVAKRLLQAIPVLIGVSFISFALLNLLPGDAATAILGLNATPNEIHALEVALHLNEPFFVRYGHWLGLALTGNLGSSLTNGQAVSSILATRLPVTFELVAGAFIVSLTFTVPVAVLAARKPHGLADRLSIALSMLGLSTPTFVLALLLIIVFAVHVGALPASGYVSLSQNVGENLRDFVLPAVSLGFGLFCGYSRVLRADIIDQLQREDYITA